MDERGVGKLPGLIGLEILEAEEGRLATRLGLRGELLVPNGYLHAATAALADTACGYGTFVGLPGEGAKGFTAVGLKTNFLGSNRSGAVACEAPLVHGGRGTQIWDATVADEGGGKPLPLFRCTHLIPYPRLISDRLTPGASATLRRAR